MLGKDATKIDRLWQDIFYHISYQPWGGADFRMLTAINIAQWDILGKASGLPVYKLLGGKAQEKLMVYNTMNGWPINGMREHTDPEKLTEFPAEARNPGHQDLSLRSRTGQRAGPTRRHVHHAVGTEAVARPDPAHAESGGR